MPSPAFRMLAGLLANSPIHSEPVTVSMDGALIPVNARIVREAVKDPITGRIFYGTATLIKLEIASLPRMPDNGDLLETEDGKVWRMSDPEDLHEGTVQCSLGPTY